MQCMAEDYYNILGVSKGASEDELKKAYRKMVHKHHPDKGGDEAQFKKVNEAYQVLSDPQRRKQYDMFGSAGNGNFGGFDGRNFDFSGQGFDIDFEELFRNPVFGDVFGSFFGGGARTRVKQRVEILNITLEEAFSGLQRTVDFGEGVTMPIDIPRGIDSGVAIKVGSTDGEEFYVRINVLPHPTLRRSGSNLIASCRIKVSESFLGCEKRVQLIDEEISVKIPSGIKSGDVVSVQGKGMYSMRGGRGDAFVEIVVESPKRLSGKAKKLLQELQDEGL